MVYSLCMKKYASIRTRIITALVLFALIPSLCVTLVLYITLTRMEQDRAVRRAEETLSQMAEELNLLVRKTEITAQTLSADRTLRMAYNDFIIGVPLSREIDYYRQITDVLNWARFSQDLMKIRVYLPDSNLTTREQLSIFGLSMLDNDSLPENIRTGNMVSGWMRSSGLVSYYQKTVLRSSYGGIILALDLDVSTFSNILKARNINGNFRIISPNDDLIAEYISNRNQQKKIIALNAQAGTWKLEALVEEEQFLTAGIDTWLLLSFGSLLVCGLLIPLAANLNAKRISRELVQLTRAIGVIQDGQYRVIPADGATRELRFLQEAYNNMVCQIDSLFNDIYTKQIELKEAQLDRLYEQIKPHFLYNILESGKWMALKNNDKETSVFLEKLARMYRLNLNRGADIVPLRQELEHTRLYLDLMPYRSRQVIKYHEEVPEELMDIQVIKLLLQPLVENSIEHGIRHREGDGLIEIYAAKKEKLVEIRICDNGIGLSEDMMRELNEGSSSGYGLENIRRRLRIQYGEAYTFHFESLHQHEGQQPQGLCVTISFPV